MYEWSIWPKEMYRIFNNFKLIILTLSIMPLVGCHAFERYSKPPEAKLNLSDQTLNQFGDHNKEALFRYLASSPRWEVRYNVRNGQSYAVRREKNQHGAYFTTLHGYYTSMDFISSDFDNYFQKRTALSFDKPALNEPKTEAYVGESEVQVRVEHPSSGSPGYSSNMGVYSGSLYLDIYEQSNDLTRRISQEIFDDVSEELRVVLDNIESVEKTGLLPEGSPYYKPAITPSFNVTEASLWGRNEVSEDVLAGGIYYLSGNVCPKTKGKVYAKVVNLKDNSLMSSEEVRRSSIIYTGWSSNGGVCFPYHSQISVYEGGFDARHKVRFELWHQDEKGKEEKLIECVKTISGWER
jgi:hypothetical protein